MFTLVRHNVAKQAILIRFHRDVSKRSSPETDNPKKLCSHLEEYEITTSRQVNTQAVQDTTSAKPHNRKFNKVHSL